MQGDKKRPYGIPTTYNGVNFRSRLEARYAALFDLLRWRWEYEPVDLPGWIPDFVILGVKPIFVEVKPFFDLPDWNEVISEIGRALDFKTNEVILCGAAPAQGFSIGHIFDPGVRFDDGWSIVRTFTDGKHYDCCSGYSGGNFIGRIHGLKSEDCERNFYFSFCDMWKEAGNIVQWKKQPND